MSAIPLFWWSPPRIPRTVIVELRQSRRAWLRLAARTRRFMLNFGDELSPLVVSHTFGAPTEWSDQRHARLFAIGSIASFVLESREATVWGTGVRTPPTSEFLRSWAKADPVVKAVRGPLSAKALSLPSSTPLGDPGLLAPRLFAPSAPNGQAIYVSHFRDWNSKSGLARLRRIQQIGLAVVAPTEKPDEVARAVSASDAVVSASLHGIILAHAYGVPVVPLSAGGGEPDFKYQDHFASLDLSYTPRTVDELLHGNLLVHLEAAGRDAERAQAAAQARADDLLRVASLA